MRVLLPAPPMLRPGGVSRYACDVAHALHGAGHEPVLLTPKKGDVSRSLEAKGVAVVDDLDAVGAPPDVIHAATGLEAVAAMLGFPEAPALCTCHSRRTDLSDVLALPQVRRWIAIDGPCRERLVAQCGVAPERVRWIPNFVDLERFAPRGAPPARPERALLFGRFKSEWSAMAALLAAVEEACARTSMTLERVGPGIGPVDLAPERLLPRFDLVFARGRSALEALAAGAAVVVTSPEGLGPLVTSDDLDRLRLLNFGGAATEPVWNADVLVREIARYDAADAAAVTARIRKEQSAEAVVGSLVAAYQEAVADHRAAGAPEPVDVARAAAPALLRARGRIGGLRLRLQGEGRPPDRRRRLRFLLARLARLGRRRR